MTTLKTFKNGLGSWVILTAVGIMIGSYQAMAVVKDGQVDPSLNISPISFNSAPEVNCVAQLSTGEIMVCGSFSNISGGIASAIARLRSDGSFDPTFHGDAGSYVTQIFPLPDGKLLISGNFAQYGGITRNRIARLNSDGSLDGSFSPNFGTSYVQIAAVQPDGKIIVNGTFTNIGGVDRKSVARLNADGSVDLSFDSGMGTDVASIYKGIVLSDGKILLAGGFHTYNGVSRSGLLRLNEDGSLDTQFVPGIPVFENVVFGMSIAVDSKIYVCGEIGAADSVYRLNPDGTLDPTFDTGNVNTNTSGRIYSVMALPDGKVIFSGGFGGVRIRGILYNRHGLFQLNSDGSVDVSFMADATGTVRALSLQTDNKVLVGGSFLNLNGAKNGGVGRLNPDSSRDLEFVGFLGNLSTITSFFILPDQKFLIAGDFGSVGTSFHDRVARLNPDGSVDETFQLDTRVDNVVSVSGVQSDGRILLGGSAGGVFGPVSKGLWHVNPDGSLDTTFDTQISSSGNVSTINILPNGKILIGGSFSTVNGVSRSGLARLNPGGSVDTDFDATVGGSVSALLPQPDGKILVGGGFSTFNGMTLRNLARLNYDGSIDTSFNIGTGADNPVRSFVLLPSNQIYVGGQFRNINGTSRSYIVRLQPDGSIDPAFKQPKISSTVYSIIELPGDKLAVGGEGDALIDAAPRQKILRLFGDGSVDFSFDVNSMIYNGSSGRVFQLGLQTDGNIIAAGQFDHLNGMTRSGFVRLLTFERPTPASYDFDGDGRSDISVFRPSNGVWYRRVSYSTINRTTQWGLGTDLMVPADLDGDFRTDIGVYRPSNGTWYWTNSSDSSISTFQFGLSGDLPVPADYDGDGKADISVFRPSTATWYRQNSRDGSFYAIQFGLPEDKPTVGDFDGDGKADIAIFRPSLGDWYQLNSSDGSVSGARFGFGTDVIVPADYDGDGRTDLAVYRPSTGIWYINNSSNGEVVYNIFGLSDDIPAPGDFDGDGKADVSVFRPSNGTWYRQNSSDGSFFAYQFGTDGDRPTQTAFTY